MWQNQNEQNSFFFDDPNPSNQKWDNIHTQHSLRLQEPIEYDSLFVGLGEPIYVGSLQHLKLVDSHSTLSQANSQKKNKAKLAEKGIDYVKNICPYISKKIVQQLVSLPYQKMVKRLCQTHKCSYQDAMTYYKLRLKDVFGINQLVQMLTPDSEEEINMKKMFRKFVVWFLRNKYMYYMLKFGRMEEKNIYIQFKNRYFLYITSMPEFVALDKVYN